MMTAHVGRAQPFAESLRARRRHSALRSEDAGAEFLVELLDARGDIHGISEQRVGEAIVGPDGDADHRARVDADARVQDEVAGKVGLLERFLYVDRRGDRGRGSPAAAAG